MEHKRAIETLVELEALVDVNTCWIDGVQIWPLLRREIWMYLLSLDEVPPLSAIGPVAAEGRTEASRGSANRHEQKVSPEQVRALEQELKSSLVPADILFWSRKEEHTEKFADGVIDRVIDPLIWDARDQGMTTIKLSSQDGVDWRGVSQYEASITVPLSKLLCVDRNPWKPRHMGVPWLGWAIESLEGAVRRFHEKGRNVGHLEPKVTLESLLDLLRLAMPDIPLTHGQMVSAARRLNGRANCFDIVLDLVRPKLVVLGVFYSTEAMAVTHACRRNGVRVVDIQHGKQGQYHGMYSHWTRLPRENYSVLPDWFWTWGEESSDNIARNLPSCAEWPKTVVGGNRWLARWTSVDQEVKCLPDTEAMLDHAKQFDKVILITLQPLSEPLPAHLLDALRHAPKSWFWLIKSHPHQRKYIGDLGRRIADTDLENYSLEMASDAPLYPLLKSCDVHVTCWSSVAYEALRLRKGTIVIDPTAKELYTDYINCGIFMYADSADSIINMIQTEPKNGRVHEGSPYIVTADAAARAAFKTCLDYGQDARECNKKGAALN